MQKEKEGILLESGTNEIEIMKFTVLGEFYGINVAKVREIIMSEKVKPGYRESRESAAFPGRTYRSRIRPLLMGMKALLPALPSVRASWSPSWILRKLLRK